MQKTSQKKEVCTLSCFAGESSRFTPETNGMERMNEVASEVVALTHSESTTRKAHKIQKSTQSTQSTRSTRHQKPQKHRHQDGGQAQGTTRHTYTGSMTKWRHKWLVRMAERNPEQDGGEGRESPEKKCLLCHAGPLVFSDYQGSRQTTTYLPSLLREQNLGARPKDWLRVGFGGRSGQVGPNPNQTSRPKS